MIRAGCFTAMIDAFARVFVVHLAQNERYPHRRSPNLWLVERLAEKSSFRLAFLGRFNTHECRVSSCIERWPVAAARGL